MSFDYFGGCCPPGYHQPDLDYLFKLLKKMSDEIDGIFDIFDKKLMEAVNDEISNLIEKGYFENILNNVVVTKDLGILSDFRYAFLPPDDFPVDTFIATASNDKKIFNQHSWSYSSSASTTIPLFTDNPYTVTNVNGEVTSCSSFVDDCLYKAGYTDLEGKVKYIGAPEPENALEPFLISKGWKKITSIGELKRGAIVATKWRDYGDYPGHCFIYLSPAEKYDCGSTDLIRSGSIDALNWSSDNNDLDRIRVTGFYHFKSNFPLSYGTACDYNGIVIAYLKNIANLFFTERGYIFRMSNDSGYSWTDWYYYYTVNSNYSLFSVVKNPTLPSSGEPRAIGFENLNSGNGFVDISGSGFPILLMEGNYILNACISAPAKVDAYITTQVYLSPTNSLDDGVLKNTWRTPLTETPTSINFSQFLHNDKAGSYVFIRCYLSNSDGDINLFKESTSSRLDVLFVR